MSSFEPPSGEMVPPTPRRDEGAWPDDVDTEPAAPVPPVDSPADSARMLELAAMTADQLVADAKAEADLLVTTAQATADQIGEASRNEAETVAAELADTKAALEAQIAALRQQEIDQRSEMRRLLIEQLSLLDASSEEGRRDP